MKLIIISRSKSFVDKAKRTFTDADCIYGDVETIPRENTVFMSPANSLGFMDGGIDYVYSRKMFPSIEKSVRSKIKELGHLTNLGRPYLRVGSAILVPYETSALICAPTMFLPHDVRSTRNAYHSFLATLILFHRFQYETLVVTSVCCGCGNMNEDTALQQMYEAYTDFKQNRYEVLGHPDPHVLLRPSIDHEQPRNFDNREIQE
jgi:O-acetyl-ADP-ribose deacetylase (regulator of RNase III)